MRVRPSLPTWTLGLVLCLAAGAVAAQSGKTAPTKTLGGGAGTGKLLTFQELKACLMEQDAIKVRGDKLLAQRDALTADREAVLKETEALKQDAARRGALNERVVAFNARMRSVNDDSAAWQQRQLTAKSKEERRALEAERVELQARATALDEEGKALQAERAALSPDYDARAQHQEQAATEWNRRQKDVEAEAAAYDDARADWRSRCANKRYQEDHEKIIRAGMSAK